MKPLVLTFAATGEATAARIVEALGAEQVPGSAEAVRLAFTQGRPIIGVCAAGILIRVLAPLLGDKHIEPPVIAVSQNGAHAVPLLGGHHGANRLAREIAEALGGSAALTTASDERFAHALDDLPDGYRLEDRSAAKHVMARVLSGEALQVAGDATLLADAGYPIDPQSSLTVAIGPETSLVADLVIRPRTLVAGVGCERGTDAAEVIGLLEATLAEAGLSKMALAAIGSIDVKADETALHRAAAHFGVPFRVFSPEALAAESHRLLNPSSIVAAEVGTPGVAEAVACKAGDMRVPKHKSRRATCAVGEASAPIDAAKFGRAVGVVHIVGLGPGDPQQRSADASAVLLQAEDWVGYGLYLDLASDLENGQHQHRFDLGDEEVRVRHALELAGEGRRVALICSGDAQIYAMATLVYELLDAEGERAVSESARRVIVESHPGISAMQAASAAAGAILGHDFCAISLSDLLTPREAILSRLEAAAEADFVTAFYNPRSRRRLDLIEKAKAIFLEHRPGTTPVVIGTNVGRPEEHVRVTTLAAFDPTEIDMLTVVLFGASTTRTLTRGDGRTLAFTPRGYERKHS
ncbi:precorrin-3B C(17)-methyltransferase [Devosia pacifica]|uniref:Precorrin-3B C(17)-methyltransferase n=1 Tax=Devosia pacifica TaxID=1335967 RepID=A0A918SBI8_9HYPH|nr:precorrin-3B C(17)-methyltransferase [Devosia pacifica]GHA30830.1 precorrin-3B C(17)-methyltransferase [Devosia pacifica]